MKNKQKTNKKKTADPNPTSHQLKNRIKSDASCLFEANVFHNISLESHSWVGLFFSRMDSVYNRNSLNVIKCFMGSLEKTDFNIFDLLMNYVILINFLTLYHPCIPGILSGHIWAYLFLFFKTFIVV